MISATEQAYYRTPAISEQLAAARRERGRSSRFAVVSTRIGTGDSSHVYVFSDRDHPGRRIVTADVLTHTGGRQRRRTWVTCVDNQDEADALIADWASYFELPRHFPTDLTRPASPADPGYWFLDPDWQQLEVPEWVARRLAQLAATYDVSDGGRADPVTAEAIAWAAITVGLHDAAYPPLLRPGDVRNTYGLTSTLTPAQTIATLWWLKDFGHPGMILGIDAAPDARDDPCELATACRIRALDQWFAAGNSLGPLGWYTRDGSDQLVFGGELLWLAHGRFGDDVTQWRRVLTALDLAETPARVADMALMWEAGASANEAIDWGRAIGHRRISEPFSWTYIALRLIPAGIQPEDVAYHSRRRGAAPVTTLVSHLLHVAGQGWMSDKVRHIPWPQRDQYRKQQLRADVAADLFEQEHAAAMQST
jgi:hypothetical protein